MLKTVIWLALNLLFYAISFCVLISAPFIFWEGVINEITMPTYLWVINLLIFIIGWLTCAKQYLPLQEKMNNALESTRRK